jgi:protein arginine kinase activator
MIKYCSSCEKALATIHVLDVKGWTIVDQKDLCSTCAESTGVVATPVKITPEALEQLINTAKGEAGKKLRAKGGPACPGCGMTAAEFRNRGRLGCPRCYLTFRQSLMPVFDRVHDATSHRGRFPGRAPPPLPTPARIAALRRELADAISAEDYERAARLRDRMRQLGGSTE